jgi:hypothetical protein
MIRAEITGGRTILAKIFYSPFSKSATRHDRQPKRVTTVEFYEEGVDDGGRTMIPLTTKTAANHVTEQFSRAKGRTHAFKTGLRDLVSVPDFSLSNEDFTKIRKAFLAKCPTSVPYWK